MTKAEKAADTIRRTIDDGTDLWFQKFEVVPGLWTNGSSDMAALLGRIHLPPSLEGLRVLDVGANDGFASFEAERRGARSVVAVDHPDRWGNGSKAAPGPDTRRHVELAKAASGSRVRLDVLDVESDASLDSLLVGHEPFDVVLFLGVLYHLRDPISAVERLRRLVADGGLLVVETHVDLLDVGRPAAAFYPAEGPSRVTWWGPNPAMVGGLLGAAGFREVAQLPPDSPRAGRYAWHAR